MHQRIDGFTLIELMVTVLIVGILASISYSSYSNQVTRSRRAEARALVQDVLQHEERFFTTNNTYTTTLTDMGYTAALNTKSNSHSISLAAGATGTIASSIAATATALITDAACTSMTLSSANIESGTGSAPADCWK
jgi:type IV pilus assembly protein PilE